MESERLSCVVCSAQVIYTDSQINSSNYSYFSQFCGELEKCGEPSDKPFNAKQFFHNVDTAARYLLICSECIKLVNEANERRISLETFEMEVIKLQIELLMKLKELEECNDKYFSPLKRIYDKVISLVEDDPEEEEGMHFGATSLRKDEVNFFREKNLDVVPTLALFRDDLKVKLVKPLKSPSPSPQPDQPRLDTEDMETADDYPPMQIDNIKDDLVFNEDEDNMNSDNDDDYNANEEEANFTDDSSNNGEETLNPKETQKKNDSKDSKIIEDPPPLPFIMSDNTSEHKKSLIQYILTPPSSKSSLQPPFSHDTVYTFLLQKYPWNYTPTSDTLTLSTIPIAVIDTGKLSCFTLQCSTCHFSAVYRDNPFTSWETSVSVQARRMFEHVVTDDSTLNPTPKVPKKKKRKKGDSEKVSNIFDNLPPLPFPLPEDASKHKQLLIQTILIPPSSSKSPLQPPLVNDTAYTFMLQSYPWNYDPTSDTLTLATIPITVEEPENDESVYLKCSTCNYSTVYMHKIHFKNPPRNMFGLVRRTFEHVVTSHLDGFRCSFPGSKCVKKMGTLDAVVKHYQRTHGNGRKKGPFHCSICGRGFTTKTNCLIHEDRHKEKGERDYVTCDTCGFSLLRSSMNQHKREFCGKRAPKCVCQICGLSFSKGWTLKDHMLRRHGGEEEKRWECEVCGKKYAVERDMKNHMINKHRVFPGIMERECRKGCRKKFTWELRLCKHEEKCNGIWISYQ